MAVFLFLYVNSGKLEACFLKQLMIDVVFISCQAVFSMCILSSSVTALASVVAVML